MQALKIVQKYFPKVTRVVDATENADVEVTDADIKNAAKRNHNACAMAVACKRKFQASGAIVSLRTVYITFHTKALRFRVGESVTREIVAFDRNGFFEAGDYRLLAPTVHEQLGSHPRPNKDGSRSHFAKKRTGIVRHITGSIRTTLGNADISGSPKRRSK